MGALRRVPNSYSMNDTLKKQIKMYGLYAVVIMMVYGGIAFLFSNSYVWRSPQKQMPSQTSYIPVPADAEKEEVLAGVQKEEPVKKLELLEWKKEGLLFSVTAPEEYQVYDGDVVNEAFATFYDIEHTKPIQKRGDGFEEVVTIRFDKSTVSSVPEFDNVTAYFSFMEDKKSDKYVRMYGEKHAGDYYPEFIMPAERVSLGKDIILRQEIVNGPGGALTTYFAPLTDQEYVEIEVPKNGDYMSEVELILGTLSVTQVN